MADLREIVGRPLEEAEMQDAHGEEVGTLVSWMTRMEVAWQGNSILELPEWIFFLVSVKISWSKTWFQRLSSQWERTHLSIDLSGVSYSFPAGVVSYGMWSSKDFKDEALQ